MYALCMSSYSYSLSAASLLRLFGGGGGGAPQGSHCVCNEGLMVENNNNLEGS
jgi:hypothetical protein